MYVFRSVLDAVMSSEAEFGSVPEGDGEMGRASEHSSILSFMAATWDCYGGKYVTNVYSSALCNNKDLVHVHLRQTPMFIMIHYNS